MNIGEKTDIDGLYIHNNKFVIDRNKLILSELSDFLELNKNMRYKDKVKFKRLNLKLKSDLVTVYKISYNYDEFRNMYDSFGYAYIYENVLFLYKGKATRLIQEKITDIGRISLVDLLSDIYKCVGDVEFNVFSDLLAIHNYVDLDLLANGNYFVKHLGFGVCIEFSFIKNIYNDTTYGCESAIKGTDSYALLHDFVYCNSTSVIEGTKYLIYNKINKDISDLSIFAKGVIGRNDIFAKVTNCDTLTINIKGETFERQLNNI